MLSTGEKGHLIDLGHPLLACITHCNQQATHTACSRCSLTGTPATSPTAPTCGTRASPPSARRRRLATPTAATWRRGTMQRSSRRWRWAAVLAAMCCAGCHVLPCAAQFTTHTTASLTRNPVACSDLLHWHQLHAAPLPPLLLDGLPERGRRQRGMERQLLLDRQVQRHRLLRLQHVCACSGPMIAGFSKLGQLCGL